MQRVVRAVDLTRDVVTAPLPRDEAGLPREALVLRDGAGVARAYLNRCEHLPVPLDGGSREFLDADGYLRCGTHGARYRREDGLCVGGPCVGARLRPLRLVQDDEGWLCVLAP